MSQSPRERYETDPAYHQMVQAMEGMIEQCHFTPSELREMAILAAIHVEMRVVPEYHLGQVSEALKTLRDFRDGQEQQEREVQFDQDAFLAQQFELEQLRAEKQKRADIARATLTIGMEQIAEANKDD